MELFFDGFYTPLVTVVAIFALLGCLALFVQLHGTQKANFDLQMELIKYKEKAEIASNVIADAQRNRHHQLLSHVKSIGPSGLSRQNACLFFPGFKKKNGLIIGHSSLLSKNEQKAIVGFSDVNDNDMVTIATSNIAAIYAKLKNNL